LFFCTGSPYFLSGALIRFVANRPGGTDANTVSLFEQNQTNGISLSCNGALDGSRQTESGNRRAWNREGSGFEREGRIEKPSVKYSLHQTKQDKNSDLFMKL
jgi:hypothetical protein